MMDPIIERRLAQTAARWRWLRFLQHSATLGVVACLAALGLGGLILGNWLTEEALFTRCCLALGAVVALTWLALALMVIRSRMGQARLASLVEQAHPPLLDRLNALVFLEERRGEPGVDEIYQRIEAQTRAAVAERPLPSPFSPIRALVHLGVLVVALLVTAAFYYRFQPLQLLQPPPLEGPLELPVVDDETKMRKEDWGEVRITKPGSDVAVTRVETVPLRIEAAASDRLAQVEWITAVNGGEETRHELPAPSEPHTAVYRPTIDVRKMGLHDWDVLAYYAQATTDQEQTFTSELYFVEVHPFQEELQQMPGGKDGAPYTAMGDLTNLIQQQQEAVREVHRQRHTPAESSEEAREQKEQLARMEEELAEEARHLNARLSVEFDPQAVQQPAARLEGAQESLYATAQQLRDRQPAEAEFRARQALERLMEARRQLQEPMDQDREAFERDEPAESPDEQAERLRGMQEQSDRDAEWRNAVRALAERQRQIAKRAATESPTAYRELTEQEEQIQEQLEELGKTNPRQSDPVRKEWREARKSLEAARQSLRKEGGQDQPPDSAKKGGPPKVSSECNSGNKGSSQTGKQSLPQGTADAQYSTGAAAEKLRQLVQALDREARRSDLKKAYQLRRMLGQQAKQCAQVAKNPDSMSQSQAGQCSRNVQETTRQLKQTAEQPSSPSSFGSQLQKSLNDANQRRLKSRCSQLGQAASGSARQRAASEVQEGLSQVSQAFDQSRPSARSRQQRGDPLQPRGRQAIQRAQRQTERLSASGRKGPRLSAKDREKLQREAAANLRQGTVDERNMDGSTRQTAQELQRELEKRKPDARSYDDLFQRLLSQLDTVHVEEAPNDDEEPGKRDRDLKHIDPSTLPPAYRGRVQRYYQKLSEEK